MRLLAEYRADRLALMVYLGETVAVAATDLPANVEVVARFLLWARPRSAPDA